MALVRQSRSVPFDVSVFTSRFALNSAARRSLLAVLRAGRPMGTEIISDGPFCLSAQLKALDRAMKNLPKLSDEQLSALNDLLSKAATLGAAALPLVIGLIQGVSVGDDIRNDPNFQAFIQNGINVVLNPNAAPGAIYGSAYNNAKNSVGLIMASLDESQYLTGAQIIDLLAQTMQNLKSQLQ